MPSQPVWVSGICIYIYIFFKLKTAVKTAWCYLLNASVALVLAVNVNNCKALWALVSKAAL